MVNAKVVEEDSYPIIICFALQGNNQLFVEGMIANAIEKKCAAEDYAFLSNVRIYNSSWYIPYIFGLVKVRIQGEGWKKK